MILYIPDRIWQMIESVKPYAMKLGAEHVLVPPPRSRNVVCMSAGAVRGRFEAIRDRANITRPGATLYALRHTVASMYMEIGGEEAARRIGGWTTSKVLRENYDQARAKILLPRAGQNLPWSHGTVPILAKNESNKPA